MDRIVNQSFALNLLAVTKNIQWQHGRYRSAGHGS